MITQVEGHFGEWFQGLDRGDLVAVTVRCTALAVRAERLSHGHLTIEGDAGVVSCERAEHLFARLQLAPGRFHVSADMPPGGGAGASTAALVALARAAGYDGPDLAAACLAVEGATDPLMLSVPDSWLWAPRRAVAMERLSPPPKAVIVGGFYGPPIRTTPNDFHFPEVGDLVVRWREATSPADCAAVASDAAARTTALRGPGVDPTAALVRELGALGWLRAHTGSARGLIFRPDEVPRDAVDRLSRAGFSDVVRFETGDAP